MHDEYSDLLQLYVDGEINPLVAILLQEHLSSCPVCRRELNQFKLLEWELSHQPTVEVPDELAAYRRAALRSYLNATTAEQDGSVHVWRLQREILQHSCRFLEVHPFSRALNWTARRMVSGLGKTARSALKKRNPLLARLIPGPT